MDDGGCRREERATLGGVVAEGDDVIECNFRRQFICGFTAPAGAVETALLHYGDCIRVETVGGDAGGIGFNRIIFQKPGPGFSHLAPAGVAGAQKEDFDFFRHNSGCFQVVYWLGLSGVATPVVSGVVISEVVVSVSESFVPDPRGRGKMT